MFMYIYMFRHTHLYKLPKVLDRGNNGMFFITKTRPLILHAMLLSIHRIHSFSPAFQPQSMKEKL